MYYTHTTDLLESLTPAQRGLFDDLLGDVAHGRVRHSNMGFTVAGMGLPGVAQMLGDMAAAGLVTETLTVEFTDAGRALAQRHGHVDDHGRPL